MYILWYQDFPMYRMWLSVFGVGYSPLVPGTCGSAVVSALFLAAAWWGLTEWGLILFLAVVSLHGAFVTVLYGDKLIAELGPDPGVIVSDEQCGQAITYMGLWSFAGEPKEILVIAATGFVLFRLFDIIKPPPVRQLEKVKGAWGVLLDDIMAGIYAAAVLQVIYHSHFLDGLWR